ncbi:MAG: hypothetical protein ABI594_15830, partial [Ginsengibacter sp.]
MKRYLLLSTIVCMSFTTAFTQNVSINNDGSAPNPSAMLDVNSPVKGVLIPRVALTGTNDITTVASPAISLLIYNTASTSDLNAVSPGFYYWDGFAWTALSTGASALKKNN